MRKPRTQEHAATRSRTAGPHRADRPGGDTLPAGRLAPKDCRPGFAPRERASGRAVSRYGNADLRSGCPDPGGRLKPGVAEHVPNHRQRRGRHGHVRKAPHEPARAAVGGTAARGPDTRSDGIAGPRRRRRRDCQGPQGQGGSAEQCVGGLVPPVLGRRRRSYQRL